MDIISLSEDLRSVNGVYDFFKATVLYTPYVDFNDFQTYVVGDEDEMRIDLIIRNMYQSDPLLTQYYLKNIDVICTINNIDNPLNIKKGAILKFPSDGIISEFRIKTETDLKKKNKSIASKLGKPNKQTKVDPSRKKYQDNGYALPPTVNKNPKSPVTIENGNFKIGGI
jgi:hypothetical protein